MPLDLRTDVSPSLHPLILDHFAPVLDVPDTAGPAALAAGKEALRAAYEYISDVNDAERTCRAMAPPAVVRTGPGGKTQHSPNVRVMPNGKIESPWDSTALIEASSAGWKVHESIHLRRLDELRRINDKLSIEVDRALERPELKEPAAVAVATGIRAHVQSMNASDRGKLLRDRIEAGDLVTANAILSAPSYLSGLDDAEQALLRAQAERRFAPTAAAQRDAVSEVLKRVNFAGNTAHARMTEIAALVEERPEHRRRKALDKLKGAAK